MATLTFDPVSEDPTNSPLEIFSTGAIAVTEMAFPAPPLETATAGSMDTEGDLIAARRHQNRQGTLTIEIVGSTKAVTRSLVATVEAKAAKLAAEGGTLQWVNDDGDTRTLDILASDGYEAAYTIEYFAGAAQINMSLLAKPYARGPEQTFGYVLDDFSSSGTLTKYAYDSGSGYTITGGKFVPANTADAKIYRTDVTGWDWRVTLKVTTGASVAATAYAGVEVKRVASNQILAVMVDFAAGTLYIDQQGSTLAPVSTGALSGNTDYWIRGGIKGNVVTAEIYTVSPTVGGPGPFATTTATLSGAGATTFGAGVTGSPGMHLIPKGTDWRFDDFKAEAYLETTEPALSFAVPNVPGDVAALGRLVVTDAQTTARRSRLFWGIESRYYSGTAAWIEGETLTPGTGAATASHAGASGSGNNTLAKLSLTTGLQVLGWVDVSRVGTFRVFGRFYCPNTNTGDASVGLEWLGEGDVTNTPVTIPYGQLNHWVLVDLGTVTGRRNTRGVQTLTLYPRVASTVAGDDIYLDGLVMIPVTEGGGQITSVHPGVAAALMDGSDTEIASTGVLIKQSSIWQSPGFVGATYEGDYLRVPASGAEGRTAHVVIKACRGDALDTDDVTRDDNIDDLSALLYVTPRYLTIT